MVLQVDIDALRSFAKALHSIASQIDQIGIASSVDMPVSGTEGASADVSGKILDAYALLGTQIGEMGGNADSSASGYEAVETAFRDQLKKCDSGVQ